MQFIEIVSDTQKLNHDTSTCPFARVLKHCFPTDGSEKDNVFRITQLENNSDLCDNSPTFRPIVSDSWRPCSRSPSGVRTPTKLYHQFVGYQIDDLLFQTSLEASNNNLWECTVCQQLFELKTSAIDHVLLSHPQRTKYYCKYPGCDGMQSKRRDSITRHLNTSHGITSMIFDFIQQVCIHFIY